MMERDPVDAELELLNGFYDAFTTWHAACHGKVREEHRNHLRDLLAERAAAVQIFRNDNRNRVVRLNG